MTMNCSALPDYCCSGAYYPSNPDVTGIGVRVAIYVSSIVGFIMSLVQPDELQPYQESLRSSYVLALSTVVAALWARYTSGVGLSLFDGEVITTLLSIVVVSYIRPSSIRNHELGFTARLAQVLFNLLYPIFGILLYYDPDHFGGAAYLLECQPNSAFVFVLYGHSISATNVHLRGWSLFVFVSSLYLELGPLFRRCLGCEQTGAAPLDWDIDRARIAGEITGVGAVLIYLIVTAEQTISRNAIYRQTIAEQWTFGQTLAVIVLLDQVWKACSRVLDAIRE